jgi:hypothetical protein
MALRCGRPGSDLESDMKQTAFDEGEGEAPLPQYSTSKTVVLSVVPLFALVVAQLVVVIVFRHVAATALFLSSAVICAYMARSLVQTRYYIQNLGILVVLGLVCASGLVGLSVISAYVVLSPGQSNAIVCLIPLLSSAIFVAYFLLSESRDRSPWLAPMYFATVLAGVVTLTIVWYLGGAQYIVTRPTDDRFGYTFKVWQRRGFLKHFFLSFDNRWAAAEAGLCYHGYTPIYMILSYIPIRVVNLYSGMPFENAARLTPFIIGLVHAFLLPATTLWAFRTTLNNRWRMLAATVSLQVLTLSVPDIWTSPLVSRADNPYAPAALLQIIAVGALLRWESSGRNRDYLILLFTWAMFAIIIPLQGTMFGLIALCFCAGDSRKKLLHAGLLTVICGIASYGSVLALAKLAGLSAAGTGIPQRMGYGASYNPILAKISPTTQFEFRRFGFVIPAAVMALTAFVMQVLGPRSVKLSMAVFLTFAPTLLDAAIFPQSHSIHPDLYDISIALLGPTALTFGLLSVCEGDRSPAHKSLPWLVLIMWGCILNNTKQLEQFFTLYK